MLPSPKRNRCGAHCQEGLASAAASLAILARISITARARMVNAGNTAPVQKPPRRETAPRRQAEAFKQLGGFQECSTLKKHEPEQEKEHSPTWNGGFFSIGPKLTAVVRPYAFEQCNFGHTKSIEIPFTIHSR